MKRSAIFLLCIFLLSAISGVLMSKASLVGKAGMTLFYQEYKFLQTWWKGAILVFVVLLIFYFIQGALEKDKPVRKRRMVQYIAMVLALAGFYFTYLDFTNTVAHRWLGTAFHTGAYLFWIGWIAISIFYLTSSGTSNENISSKTSIPNNPQP